jgi:hypothetical protein
MPLATLRKLADFAQRGGVLIATRRLPAIVPGYETTDADQAAMKEIVHKLFDGPEAPAIFLPDESQIGEAIAKDRKIRPDVVFDPPSPEIGFVRRNSEGAALYFVANTSNKPKQVTAKFRFESTGAEQLDPITGKIRPLDVIGHPESYSVVKLDLAPYGSTVLLFSNRMVSEGEAAQAAAHNEQTQDISSGWTVAFGPNATAAPIDPLHSWTDDQTTQGFSGVATYANHVTVSNGMSSGKSVWIDFGEGKPTTLSFGRRPTLGYAAMLDAPVREAAVVYVNGKEAGSVWCAPYRVEVSGLLKAGENDIRIEVGNTAVNYLAVHGFPNYDYRSLVRKYGDRFTPPSARDYRSLPSGLLGGIKLVGLSGS